MVASIFQALSPIEVLELTIIGEARGEPIEGQVAVGCVCRNRLHNNPSKYKDYLDVCLEPKQFSCWNELDPNYGVLLDLANMMLSGQNLIDPYIRQCLLVARGISDWSIIDNTKGSEYYMTKDFFDNHRPLWARHPIDDPVQHGKQVFFNI